MNSADKITGPESVNAKPAEVLEWVTPQVVKLDMETAQASTV